MEEFALVEADFQQYYQLDLNAYFEKELLEKKGFLRYARLFGNLPPESRIMMKLSPVGSWTWRDEALSLVLHEINLTNTILVNTNRKKGSKPAKPDEQFLPEYMKEAKKEYQKLQKEQKVSNDDVNSLEQFWKAMNPNATYLDSN